MAPGTASGLGAPTLAAKVQAALTVLIVGFVALRSFGIDHALLDHPRLHRREVERSFLGRGSPRREAPPAAEVARGRNHTLGSQSLGVGTKWLGEVMDRVGRAEEAGDGAAEEEEPEEDGEEGERERASRSPHRDFKHCAKPEGPRQLPSLLQDGMPLNVTQRIGLENVFVHKANHASILRGPRALHRYSYQYLPENFKDIADQYGPFGSCAVVGNAGNLKYTTFGAAIDSHDIVVRLNHAPTEGYQRFVGTKTSFRILNSLWTNHYASWRWMNMHLPSERGMGLVVSRTDTHQFDKLIQTFHVLRPDIMVLMLSSRLTSAVRRLLIKFRLEMCARGFGPYTGGNTPSSGLVAVVLFSQLCNTTTVYGFGKDKLINRIEGDSTAYHYFSGKGARKEGNPVHSFVTEQLMIGQMEKDGLVRTCRFLQSEDGDESLGAEELKRKNRRCGVQKAPGGADRLKELLRARKAAEEAAGGWEASSAVKNKNFKRDIAERLSKIANRDRGRRGKGGAGMYDSTSAVRAGPGRAAA